MLEKDIRYLGQDTLYSPFKQLVLWKQMGQGHLLCRERRLISEMDSSAPRGAFRSIGHWDDRSAIMIVSAVILQVLGSTSLLVEPKMVSQCEFWGHLQRPVGEGLGPNYPSV